MTVFVIKMTSCMIMFAIFTQICTHIKVLKALSGGLVIDGKSQVIAIGLTRTSISVIVSLAYVLLYYKTYRSLTIKCLWSYWIDIKSIIASIFSLLAVEEQFGVWQKLSMILKIILLWFNIFEPSCFWCFDFIREKWDLERLLDSFL